MDDQPDLPVDILTAKIRWIFHLDKACNKQSKIRGGTWGFPLKRSKTAEMRTRTSAALSG